MKPLLRSLLLVILVAAPLSAGTIAHIPEPARFEWKVDAAALAKAEAYTSTNGCGFDLGTHPSAAGQPFFFSVAVPEGNYRVTVTFGDDHAASATTVKAESRRLMVESVTTAAGESATRTFIVNVRTPILPPPPKNASGGNAVVLIPGEQGSLTWDEKLTLEFSGPAPRIRALEIAYVNVPTVFLAGDSTVTDQRGEPGASWGQMLPRFLGPDVAVANHAESGETLKSFLTGLRLAKVLSQIKPGDYLFIQFGHNDQKKQWPQTYAEARTTYALYLRAYVAEARLRGATPVLVTSVQRRMFDASGHIKDSLGDYPQAVRDVAAAEHVALIDLTRMSTAFYEALGPARAPLAFNDGGRDITHHDNYGAYELAKCVAQAIREAHLPLAASLASDFTGFDPAHPDAPENFHLPASPVHRDAALRGN